MAALSGGYIVYDNVKFRLKSWRNKKIHLCDVLAAGLIDFNQRSRQLSIHGKRNHHFMKYFNIHNKYFLGITSCFTTHRIEEVAGDEDHVEQILQLGVAHQF